MTTPSDDDRVRNAGTFLGLAALLLSAFGLLVLLAVVMQSPHVFVIVLVVLGFAGYGGLHYVLWGRRLSRRHDDEQQDSP